MDRPRLSLLAAALSFVAAATPLFGAPDPAPACSSPEYRRLDFWAGDWDAYEEGDKTGKPNARCRVDLILNGCVVRESYEQNDGLVGQSFTIYDAARKIWHQSWVTNRGLLLLIDGVFDGDTLTLQGPLRSPGGGRENLEKLIRGKWRKEPGGVREVAETSTDGGKTWQPLFDIHFRPHR